MREMLEPIFGESGAVVAQFVITLVAVLVLIGLLYWLVQRFSGIRFAGNARGRVPRLALIDALSVDGRRKLVLVRRDNVEHLLLIGGTSDLVVEPSIVRGAPAGARPRQAQAPRPQTQTQPQPQPQTAAAAAPQTAPQPQPQPQTHPVPQRAAEPSGISEPIPFPQAPPPRLQPRSTPRSAEPPAATPAAPEQPAPPAHEPVPQRRAAVRAVPAAELAVAAAGGRPSMASAHFEEPARPSRIESVFSLADALDEIADEPMSAGTAAEFAGPKAHHAPRHFEEAAAVPAETGDEPATEALDLSPEPAPAIATDDAAAEATQPEGEAESTTKVSDLEREMARLLGEITSRRES